MLDNWVTQNAKLNSNRRNANTANEWSDRWMVGCPRSVRGPRVVVILDRWRLNPLGSTYIRHIFGLGRSGSNVLIVQPQLTVKIEICTAAGNSRMQRELPLMTQEVCPKARAIERRWWSVYQVVYPECTLNDITIIVSTSTSQSAAFSDLQVGHVVHFLLLIWHVRKGGKQPWCHSKCNK